MKTYQFTIQGITCEACIKLVKKRLGKIIGITTINLDLKGKLGIQAERNLDASELVQALKDTNYTLKH